MYYLKNKRSLYHYFCLIIVYIFAVSSIFSPIRALPFYNYLLPILIGMWLFFTSLDFPRLLFKPTIYRLLVFYFIIYTVVFSYIMNNSSIGNRYLEFAQISIFFLEYQKNTLINRSSDNEKLIKYFIHICMVIRHMG